MCANNVYLLCALLSVCEWGMSLSLSPISYSPTLKEIAYSNMIYWSLNYMRDAVLCTVRAKCLLVAVSIRSGAYNLGWEQSLKRDWYIVLELINERKKKQMSFSKAGNTFQGTVAWVEEYELVFKNSMLQRLRGVHFGLRYWGVVGSIVPKLLKSNLRGSSVPE